MRTIAVLVSMLCVCCSSYSILMATDILRYQYYLSDDTGFLAQISFNAAGTINVFGSLKILPVYWMFDSPTHAFAFLDASKVPLVRFSLAKKDFFGKWRLSGYYLRDTFPANWNYYLEQII